jgi:hypothetical protein
VAGRVDEVELVLITAVDVPDGRGGGLDGDPALPFQVHVVEQLLVGLALRDRLRQLKHGARRSVDAIRTGARPGLW